MQFGGAVLKMTFTGPDAADPTNEKERSFLFSEQANIVVSEQPETTFATLIKLKLASGRNPSRLTAAKWNYFHLKTFNAFRSRIITKSPWTARCAQESFATFILSATASS